MPPDVQLADIIAARSAQGRDYGVILLPEGLIEFIPEVGNLIAEINEILAQGIAPEPAAIAPKLSPISGKVKSRNVCIARFRAIKQPTFESFLLLDSDCVMKPPSLQVFELLPAAFRCQLLLDRDPHGNVQVAKIETERLLLELVEVELAARKLLGTFRGKFNGLTHYMGYEGRASLPTNFDAT